MSSKCWKKSLALYYYVKDNSLFKEQSIFMQDGKEDQELKNQSLEIIEIL